jgi:hypothetical protein
MSQPEREPGNVMWLSSYLALTPNSVRYLLGSARGSLSEAVRLFRKAEADQGNVHDPKDVESTCRISMRRRVG